MTQPFYDRKDKNPSFKALKPVFFPSYQTLLL